MPRKAKVVREQQIYRLAEYGATVTIDYDVNHPPPFYQPGPGIVIVGMAGSVSGTITDQPVADRAELEAMRDRVAGRTYSEPQRPKILTSADFAPPGFDEAVQAAISQAEPISTEGADA